MDGCHHGCTQHVFVDAKVGISSRSRPAFGQWSLTSLVACATALLCPGASWLRYVKIFCFSKKSRGGYEDCFFITLLWTDISPPKVCLKMIFLFPRWDMLVPWRVLFVFFNFCNWWWAIDGGFYRNSSPVICWWNSFPCCEACVTKQGFRDGRNSTRGRHLGTSTQQQWTKTAWKIMEVSWVLVVGNGTFTSFPMQLPHPSLIISIISKETPKWQELSLALVNTNQTCIALVYFYVSSFSLQNPYSSTFLHGRYTLWIRYPIHIYALTSLDAWHIFGAF